MRSRQEQNKIYKNNDDFQTFFIVKKGSFVYNTIIYNYVAGKLFEACTTLVKRKQPVSAMHPAGKSVLHMTEERRKTVDVDKRYVGFGADVDEVPAGQSLPDAVI